MEERFNPYRSYNFETTRSAESEQSLMLWSPVLRIYNFEVKYKPGMMHRNADGLSRQSFKNEDVNFLLQKKKRGRVSRMSFFDNGMNSIIKTINYCFK